MTAPHPVATTPAFTDIASAAAHFAVSRWTIERWIKRGVLPARRLPGGTIRIPVDALDSIGEPAGDPQPAP